MKKQLTKFLFFALIAGAVAGCGLHDDKDCNNAYLFYLQNETEHSVVVEVSGQYREPGHAIISKGETKEVYYYTFEAGCGEAIDDVYGSEDLISTMPNTMVIDMKINDEIMPETIWTRKYWDFSNGIGFAKYTLLLTDELIENLKSEQEL
jgi:hypothetical protein